MAVPGPAKLLPPHWGTERKRSKGPKPQTTSLLGLGNLSSPLPTPSASLTFCFLASCCLLLNHLAQSALRPGQKGRVTNFEELLLSILGLKKSANKETQRPIYLEWENEKYSKNKFQMETSINHPATAICHLCHAEFRSRHNENKNALV